jgi:hypothetical protein
MGHMRLGSLPDTTRWKRVVGLLAEGGDVAAVAGATSTAAQDGLDLAHGDAGLCHAVYLLSQFVLAARQEDFAAALQSAGIKTPSDPGLFDIIGGFSEAIDQHLVGNRQRTDIGEMAQLAAVESLTALIGPRSQSLFGTTTAEIQDAAYQLSTKKGFATLAHDFFSRFTQRFLTYHLGRELSNHVGGNGRFADPSESSDFVGQLGAHCREASEIVRDFAGGWYSKANFEDGISPQKARNFANYALTKLKRELKVRGDRDG